jgi:hypothetical protein
MACAIATGLLLAIAFLAANAWWPLKLEVRMRAEKVDVIHPKGGTLVAGSRVRLGPGPTLIAVAVDPAAAVETFEITTRPPADCPPGTHEAYLLYTHHAARRHFRVPFYRRSVLTLTRLELHPDVEAAMRSAAANLV